MIRAEELMLGDWVMSIHPAVPRPIKVTEVGGKDIGYKNGILHISFIEPIPITKEILEKNGFVIKKKWAQMGNFGDSPLIMWHFEDEPILRDFKHELEIHQNDTGKVHIQILCEYVHELQNALKMCGITKEIEL